MNFDDAISSFYLDKNLNIIDIDITVLNNKMNYLFKFNSWSYGNGHFVEYFNFPRKLKKHEQITCFERDIRNFAVRNIMQDKKVGKTVINQNKKEFYIVLEDDLTSYEKKVIRDVIKKAGHL